MKNLLQETTQPPNQANPTLTPMLAQYLSIKSQYKDAILFYRLGDFYEMFFEDAVIAAPILEVTLTSRDKNAANPIPLCGIPYHAVSNYIQKLLNRGFKVAICEQVEDPKATKGIVKRDVVRVLTPSLIGDPELVAEDSRNYLLTLHKFNENKFEAVLLDLLGGQVKQGEVEDLSQLNDLLFSHQPKEILLNEATAALVEVAELLKSFPNMTRTIRNDYFSKKGALEALTLYLKETQKLEKVSFLAKPLPLFDKSAVSLDATTLKSLEILQGTGGKDAPSLFQVLDSTRTPMGRRTLKDWLIRPLNEKNKICARLDAVENLINTPTLFESLRLILAEIRDLERLTTKTGLGLAMPRDLFGIREISKKIPLLKTLLAGSKSKLLQNCGEQLDPLSKLTRILEEALIDSPPAIIRDGGIFKDTYSTEIMELRLLSRDAKGTIASIEVREKRRTQIGSLKIKYSKVFGYTIEITNSHLSKVPKDYIRKQTIANGERFITEELKSFEEKVLSSEARLKTLEESLFLELRKTVADVSEILLKNAKSIAEIDVLLCFAEQAKKRAYVRPQITTQWTLNIKDGKHPVIESLYAPGKFVPNSVLLDTENCRTLLITGPNMAGKSTIMRQVALITLMAHIGCFVPAASASIPIVDAIYTRIGSSDDIAGGRSTFMVEMTETAHILQKATERSLILIDEIGRGTSTYDGLSLAWSLVEFIHNEVKAKTMFATHFHELTVLEKSLPQLKNANVLVEKWQNQIIFLHRLSPGVCSQSYGIEVAKLAHLPSKVLLRAKEILGVLESQSSKRNQGRHNALRSLNDQLGFFEDPDLVESRSSIDA